MVNWDFQFFCSVNTIYSSTKVLSGKTGNLTKNITFYMEIFLIA